MLSFSVRTIPPLSFQKCVGTSQRMHARGRLEAYTVKVRVASEAQVCVAKPDVRFTPNSDCETSWRGLQTDGGRTRRRRECHGRAVLGCQSLVRPRLSCPLLTQSGHHIVP